MRRETSTLRCHCAASPSGKGSGADVARLSLASWRTRWRSPSPHAQTTFSTSRRTSRPSIYAVYRRAAHIEPDRPPDGQPSLPSRVIGSSSGRRKAERGEGEHPCSHPEEELALDTNDRSVSDCSART